MKKTNFTKSLLTVALLSIAGAASAQLISGSVFLKGKYVEAGICGQGDFGAPAPPAGYHPHTSLPIGPLGFVADPDMDGWSVGTPAYKGDFFTPGYPYEAFNVQIGAVRAQSSACLASTGTATLSGTNTAYSAIGSKVIGVWEGVLDSVTIKQETTLDTLGLYFTIRVTLTNTASAPKNNIYYARSVDPDNDVSWGGSFVTKNKIEFQLPNAANASVVSARGTVDTTSYLALGTADTNAKCFIYPTLRIEDTTDLSTIMAETYPGGIFTVGSDTSWDVGMGLAFYIPHLASLDSAADSVAYKTTNAAAHHRHPANQKSFTFFYAFSRPAVDSAIKELVDTATHIPVSPTRISNVNENANVRVYPNPSSDIINITNLEATDKITLYDMMGKATVPNWILNTSPVNTCSMQNMPTGNYTLVVSDAHGNMKARVPIRKL